MDGYLTLGDISARANEETPAAVDLKQTKLTRKYLVPHISGLKADMLALRERFDDLFEAGDHPRKSAYPKGFCYEISLGVLDLLQQALADPKTPAMRALREFCQQGGIAKRVWGNLRNQYFQNAFQFGSLYLDVANDTVDVAKPKVEVRPIAKSGFAAIDNFETYAQIAEIYWKGTVYSNRHIPDLMVMFPIIFVGEAGKIELHANYQTILYRNLESNFQLSEDFLTVGRWKDRDLPEEVLSFLKDNFGARQAPVSDEEVGRVFVAARQSSLRFDTKRCQIILDKAVGQASAN